MPQLHSLRHFCLYILLILFTSLGITGCTFQRTPHEAVVRPVSGPPGQYAYILAWVDNWLVIQVEPTTDGTAFSGRLWRLHPNGSGIEQLPIPDHPGCDRQAFVAPTRLPDGRLGYIDRCFPSSDSALANLYMMAYDMHTGHVEALLPYPLPSQQVGTDGYSWNPTMSKGITNDGNGGTLSPQLYWFTPEHPEQLDVGFPQAFGTAWAPDDEHIAFVAAPEQGLSGIARGDATFNLYLMRADGTHLQAIVEGFRYPAGIAWSPDGRWLAFPATFGTLAPEAGLWVIDVTTGRQRLVAQGNFSLPVWSPDGRQLAVIRSEGEYPNRKQQITIVEIGTLLDSE